MDIGNQHITEIEYITVYPQRTGNNYVMLAVALLESGTRVLVYGTNLQRIEMGTEITSDYQDYCLFGKTVRRIETARKMVVNTELYCIPDDKGMLFSIMVLDGTPTTKTIKKEEIEKLFGCKVDG